MSSIIIREIERADWAEWLRMRLALWPDDADAHEGDMERWFVQADTDTFVAVRAENGLAGFAEVSTRTFAEGCVTSPVAFLEGWYVDADLRGQGVGKRLVVAVEQWARERGMTELASDALLDNVPSHRAHEALGFVEVDRAVLYRKRLER